MAGAPVGSRLAPPLGKSARVTGHRDYVINVLLHGLTGPLDGNEYPGGIMVAMGTNTDQWIADVSTYVRNAFGNSSVFVTPEQVATVRKRADRKTPWTQPELEAVVPRPLENATEWTLSASHNAGGAPDAISGSPFLRWDSGTALQQPGMWFQIELPQPARITEIQLDATVPFTLNLGRGRGAPTVPPTPRARGVPGAPARLPAGRGGAPAAGPFRYSVQVSGDGATWSAPIAQGAGGNPTTVIAFAPVETKFIRINQAGRPPVAQRWSISRIRLYEAAR